jgi:hypothetical protein
MIHKKKRQRFFEPQQKGERRERNRGVKKVSDLVTTGEPPHIWHLDVTVLNNAQSKHQCGPLGLNEEQHLQNRRTSHTWSPAMDPTSANFAIAVLR